MALLQNRIVQGALSTLIAGYMALAYRSVRWEYRGMEPIEDFWRERKPFVAVFWHGRMLMLPKFWRGAKLAMLISQSKDGEVVAKAIERLGFETVRGSSRKKGEARDRGGFAAVRRIVELTGAGRTIAITPDGPRGPRMRSSAGPAVVARLTGLPVVAVSWSVRRGRVLGSWDRMLIPTLFGRGVFVISPPMAPDADDEAMRLRIEEALNAATREADLACGRAPVEPA